MKTTKNILRFLDNSGNPADDQNFVNWLDQDAANIKELEGYENLLVELNGVQEFKTFDVDAEWETFKGNVNFSADTIKESGPATQAEGNAPDQKNTNSPIIPLIQNEAKVVKFGYTKILSIAASVLVLIAAGWFLFSPDKLTYNSFETQELAMNLDLPDGTKASLAPHSILIVPSKFEGLTERRVEMTKGKATFDVFENVDQPFVVDNGQTAIKVLGTIFVVDNTGEETVLENIEGKVKFYEKGEEDKGIVLLQGDKFKYNENSGFENLVVKEEPKPTPVPVKVPNLGPSHNLGYLMNKLMEASDHKIIPAADLDYDPSERVHIKIDKNLDKFISDLKAKALFELLPRDCEGCFEITRFAKK